jgi:SAM-dependent methyltransferase
MGTAEAQGRLWGAAAIDWPQLNEPSFLPVYTAVFDAVGLGDGARLLDAGCGSGLALQVADKRGAIVTGVDASEGLLALAMERAPTADLRQGDLEELPYPDNSFDIVTAFNAVQYAGDPVNALRELRRVAVPGGRIGVVTWSDAERCETRVVLAAIGSLLPPPPPHPGGGGPFALSTPGRLEELAAAARLVPQQAGEVPIPFVHPDLDTAVRAHLATGPARRAIERAGLVATMGVLQEALAGSRQPDGSCRQDNAFRYLIAEA